MSTKFSSRDFNQDTSGAKRAAEHGPVYITDRGRPSHVLMKIEDFERLARAWPSIGELLAGPVGVEDVDFEAPLVPDVAVPAEFD